MKRILVLAILASAWLCAMATPSLAVDFGIDPNATWLGFMNVFELPVNGGNYVFGSSWGTTDLTANFTPGVLTLGPNSVGDPSAFWYTPAGGPGSTGNKITDANLYQESTGVYTGQTIHFSGTVLTNTMVSPYTEVAFIKDFAPDYSSSVASTIALTPGPFSISLDTINDPARHIQFGFTVNGPDVWITDRDPIGTVTLAVPSAGVAGDYNGNGTVDAADYVVWRQNLGQTFALPNRDPSNSGVINQQDYTYWKGHFSNSGAGASVSSIVPEPSSIGLTLLAVLSFGFIRRRGR
jgi:hypothetical protein